MNNHSQQQQREQGSMPDFDFADYIANATGNDTQQQHGLDIYSEFPQQRSHAQMGMDAANMAAQNMLSQHNRMDQLPQGPPQNIISAEMLNLKGRLEQQMKLQQLQQLILQQQVRPFSRTAPPLPYIRPD
jgi:hypothetical protein